MSWLLDTNVVSELRRGSRVNAGLAAWFDGQNPRDLYLSVVTIGEIRQGIEDLRRRNTKHAAELDQWLAGIGQFYEDRLLYVDGDVSESWGRLQAGRRAPVVDALIAATARVHDLTVVTRNTRDFAKLDVRLLNPFSAG